MDKPRRRLGAKYWPKVVAADVTCSLPVRCMALRLRVAPQALLRRRDEPAERHPIRRACGEVFRRVRIPSRELPAMLRDGSSWNVLSVILRATYLRFMEERRRGEHRPASCVDTRNRVFRGFLLCARESAYPDVNSEAMRRGRRLS